MPSTLYGIERFVFLLLSGVQELTAPIVKYHLHKTIKQRASVSLLKALFLVERPKSYFSVNQRFIVRNISVDFPRFLGFSAGRAF